MQRSGVRFARTGTSVTPTQPAMASAARAEVLASASWPISAAAPEYSAKRSAAVSAVIERRNARTAGRSALAQSCEMVDSTLTAGDHKGTGTDSTISRRTESVVSDFFCSEAWRELA